MKTIVIVLTTCLGLLYPCHSRAEAITGLRTDTVTMRLDSAENIFVRKNFTLLAQRYNIDAQKALALQAKLFPNPTFSFGTPLYQTATHHYFPMGKEGEISMSANLLSLGAVDFGIIIDGAVVMVEGLFVVLDRQAKEIGMERFNKLVKTGLIKNNSIRLAKAIFFSKLIIITGLLPIFAFQKVEGKMFSPLAYTLGFALLGALITTLTLVPVLIRLLLKKNVQEKHNPIVSYITRKLMAGFDYTYRHKKVSLITAAVIIVVGLGSFKFLGSEFIPEMNEGAIWLRAQLPYSVSLDKSIEVSKQIRGIVMTFPQVQSIVAQTGRPDDGTDVAGFYNNEFDIQLYPEKEWKPRMPPICSVLRSCCKM